MHVIIIYYILKYNTGFVIGKQDFYEGYIFRIHKLKKEVCLEVREYICTRGQCLFTVI